MRKAWGGIAVVVAWVAAAAPGAADVICKKKSGVLVARTACKGKETRLDPDSVGLVGPTGPTGPPGAPGPSGLGARWALVDIDGEILAQSGGIALADATTPGIFYLDFGADLSNKNIQVTPSCTPADCNFRGTASGALCGGAPLGYACSAAGTDDTSHLVVFTLNAGDTAPQPHPFFIAVF